MFFVSVIEVFLLRSVPSIRAGVTPMWRHEIQNNIVFKGKNLLLNLLVLFKSLDLIIFVKTNKHYLPWIAVLLVHVSKQCQFCVVNIER